MPKKTKRDRHAILIEGAPGDDQSALLAQTVLRPTVQAAATLMAYQCPKGAPESDLTTTALTAELSKQCTLVRDGNLGRAEGMLVAQAHTLDALFGNLARRAQGATMLPQLETFMRLAFKAQAQCRSTLETLAAIKNPPVVIAKQANVTTGPQQVNNGVVAPSHAGKTESAPNKVLEYHDGERMDTRAPGATSGRDTALASVGAINRTKDGGG